MGESIIRGEEGTGLVTADYDLVPDDPRGYRVAFTSAFGARGIYPSEVGTLADDALRWRPPDVELAPLLRGLAGQQPEWPAYSDRHGAFAFSNTAARELWPTLQRHPELCAAVGLLAPRKGKAVVGGRRGQVSNPAVGSIRPIRRLGPDGRVRTDLIVELTQSFRPDGETAAYRGGATLIANLEDLRARYLVRKRLGSARRMDEQRAFAAAPRRMTAREAYFDLDHDGARAFAAAHRPW